MLVPTRISIITQQGQVYRLERIDAGLQERIPRNGRKSARIDDIRDVCVVYLDIRQIAGWRIDSLPNPVVVVAKV